MANQPLESIVLNPKQAADSTVIWLHGLGASGHDFEPVVPHLGSSDKLAVRFIFPHAPEQAVTVNNGYVMPAWYDILDRSIDRKVDQAGIQASVTQINQLIEQEIAQGILATRIILAGFSQGGLIALEAGLRHSTPLAGVIALSTYLAGCEPLPQGKTPVFVGHGTADPVVPLTLGEGIRSTLQAAGYPVDWHSYAMEHSVCMEEIRDIGAWITARLD